MNRIVFSLLILFVASLSYGQRIAINETGAVANASAKLDIASTTQGFLGPRMTEAEKLAIVSPADGLMVYQTDNFTGLWYYDTSIPSWLPFRKPLAGSVDMETGTFSGTGFTFGHINDGKEEVFFDSPYLNTPEVIVSSGLAPGSESEPCDLAFTDCSNDNVRTFMIQRWNGSTWQYVMANEFTDCTFNFNRYTYYPYGNPDNWTANPLCPGCVDLPGDCFSPGDQFRVQYMFDVTGASYIKSWIDWNQDGFFSDAVGDQELILEVGPGVGGGIQSSVAITVPAFAINGSITMRVLAQATGGFNILPCSGVEPNGETEDYEIPICSGNIPVFPPVPTICNILQPSNFGFRISCTDLDDNPRDVKYFFKVAER